MLIFSLYILFLINESKGELLELADQLKPIQQNESVFVDLIKTIIAKQKQSNAIKIQFKGDEKEIIDTPIDQEKMTVDKFQLSKDDYDDYDESDPRLDLYDDLRRYTNENIDTLSGRRASNSQTFNQTTGNQTTEGNQTGLDTEDYDITRRPFTLPKKKKYLQTVTLPVFFGLASLGVIIWLVFRLPSKIIDIVSDEPFLTWDKYYEEEMQKQGLMLDGGFCMCEDRIMKLLSEAGVQLPKTASTDQAESDIELPATLDDASETPSHHHFDQLDSEIGGINNDALY